MAISLDLRALEPLHYITAERVASLKRIVEIGAERSTHDEFWRQADDLVTAVRDARVVLMALEQLTTPVSAQDPPKADADLHFPSA